MNEESPEPGPSDQLTLDVTLTDSWLSDLRSDHAGETGAVAIYQGILSVSADEKLRVFAERHIETEREHLLLIADILPPSHRSALLPLWRIAGFLTGFLPALFGPKAVYATIEAVESFVVHHYARQIKRLELSGEERQDLLAVLLRCHEDEIHHRDEAHNLCSNRGGLLIRSWQLLVRTGSNLAVAAARQA